MRLEPFGQLTMRYTHASWQHPYGRAGGPAQEALGFGCGDGDVSGELEGCLRWANFPRRREDGVWTPNLRGVITTRGGEEILIAVHGQSVLENAPGVWRAVVARVELAQSQHLCWDWAELVTETESYRWLNTSFLVGEGEIDEEREVWWLLMYICVNEEVRGSPAIGSQRPAQFR